MAFRKRNVVVNNATSSSSPLSSAATPRAQALPGTKPSSLAPHVVTSTGTQELDALLGGHGGLVLGSSLLIGEYGTTDYAGALLRAYAAEGLLQRHHIHVVGVDKQWTHNLPGVSADDKRGSKSSIVTQQEKMKIAWRYENMERATPRALPVRSVGNSTESPEIPFCHSFDLTKRLSSSPEQRLNFVAINNKQDPLLSIVNKIAGSIASADSATVHRIVVPLLLSPIYYPLAATEPFQVLRFMHALRALLKQYSTQATAMISIPLSLFPRSSGTVRWMEHLNDGVIEMVPFPYIAGASMHGDAAQGILKILRLPLTTDRGEGGAGAGNTIGDDLAFTLGRKKFVIEPFSLPPIEGDQDAQKEAGKITAKDVEF